MPIHIRCPRCGHGWLGPDSALGHPVNCPACCQTFVGKAHGMVSNRTRGTGRASHYLVWLAAKDDLMAAILVIGFTGLFGGLLFLWLWPMVSVVPILVGCVGTLTYFSARRAHRRNSVTTLARAILRDIKRCGLRKFELASVEGFGDFPDDIRGQAAEEVYAWYYAAGARDLKLTHAERAELDTLATRLALSGAAKASVEKRQGKSVV